MKENISEELNEAKEEFEEYINARLDLAKLHTAENLSRFFAGMLVKMGLFYLFFFVLLFSSLAISFWINDYLDSQGLGFIIVAGFYLLLALIFYALRRSLIHRPIIQSFIQLFFPKFTDYDEPK
ncbi:MULTISPECIES: phage holin family protein [unclassified Carboxylicivirga]|uniref:phage holin family protein n=1 Tax=Carboxylicivirga TaxID=1628153 RepID=UPI003D356126